VARALESCCRGLTPVEREPPLTDAVPPGARVQAGVFVTLFHGDRLRGCLGSARGKDPLWESVPRLAVAAATRDSRFDPLDARELSAIRIEITILGKLTPLPADPAVVLSGLSPLVHGVHLKNGSRTALLLPQVARRLRWGATELLRQLSLKAGLDRDAWREPSAELSAFCARSFGASASGDLLVGPPMDDAHRGDARSS
jgi:AmmeMemoRadiSam system protein A